MSLAPVHIYKCFLDAFFGITLAEAPLRRATAHYCRRPCASGQHRPSTRVASSVRRHTHIHMRVHAGPARFRSGGHACRAEGHATCSVRRQSLRRCHQPGGALCVAWGSRRSPRPPRRLSFKSMPRRCLWGGRPLFPTAEPAGTLSVMTFVAADRAKGRVRHSLILRPLVSLLYICVSRVQVLRVMGATCRAVSLRDTARGGVRVGTPHHSHLHVVATHACSRCTSRDIVAQENI